MCVPLGEISPGSARVEGWMDGHGGTISVLVVRGPGGKGWWSPASRWEKWGVIRGDGRTDTQWPHHPARWVARLGALWRGAFSWLWLHSKAGLPCRFFPGSAHSFPLGKSDRRTTVPKRMLCHRRLGFTPCRPNTSLPPPPAYIAEHRGTSIAERGGRRGQRRRDRPPATAEGEGEASQLAAGSASLPGHWRIPANAEMSAVPLCGARLSQPSGYAAPSRAAAAALRFSR